VVRTSDLHAEATAVAPAPTVDDLEELD
jgi:hypothetical protein